MGLKLRIDERKYVETFTELHKQYMRKMCTIAWALRGTAIQTGHAHYKFKIASERSVVIACEHKS